ncbi:hypothetical protein THF1C08_30437 [Vibrio jasicida]|uniref:Uncharacterized protein n=1 Tax=Vibrio jasicida TaxID=766224 RepID=A0AAU9QJK0_9VIBR|nr:hypothetical protein THF1A12_180005 [Vibrio jasicida]CAH1590777.1 hypothetical protein THF1C08_30437 [Vibrio jasicida]
MFNKDAPTPTDPEAKLVDEANNDVPITHTVNKVIFIKITLRLLSLQWT